MAKVGNHFIYQDTEFWAERGLIMIMDYRDSCHEDERFKVVTRAEFAARAIARNDEVPEIKYADERNELIQLIVDMCACVKEAKKQGDPMDPEAAKRVALANKKVLMQTHYDPERHRSNSISANLNKLDQLSKFESYIPPIPQAPADKPVVELYPDTVVNQGV